MKKKLMLEVANLLPLSAYTLNSYLSNRAFWLCRKVYKLPTGSQANFEWGNSVEWCIKDNFPQMVKKHPEIIDRGKITHKSTIEKIHRNYSYRLNKSGISKEDGKKYIETLVPMVEMGIHKLKQYGKIVSYQDKLKFNIPVLIEGEEYKIPLIGYTDFLMEHKSGTRVLVDVKCTSKFPSKDEETKLIKESSVGFSNKLQQTLYSRATNYQTDLLFIGYTKKGGAKADKFTVQNDPQFITIASQAIISMEMMLRMVTNAKDLKYYILPSPEDYQWHNNVNRESRKEVWGW